MKNILDKLDQSSLWLRISIVTALALILAAGLFFVKKQDDATRAAAPTVRQTISTSSNLPRVNDEDIFLTCLISQNMDRFKIIQISREDAKAERNLPTETGEYGSELDEITHRLHLVFQ